MAGRVAGVPLATLPGFGNNAAAIVPDGTNSGVLLFQPIDGGTFTNLDVVAIPYTIDQGAIVAGSAPTPALTVTEDRLREAVKRLATIKL